MGFTQEQIEKSELWKRLERDRKQAEFKAKYPSMGGVGGDNKHLLPESVEELLAAGIERDDS